MDKARTAVEEAGPVVTGGVLTKVVSGFGTLVAVASAVILGALITYYLLKAAPAGGARSSTRSIPGCGTSSTTSSVKPAGSSGLRAGPHRHVGHRVGGHILAVPATVIASNSIARLRSRGSLARVAERAEPAVRRMLG